MVRLKNGALPLGWMAIVVGLAATAGVYSFGFLYAETLTRPSDFTGAARLAVLAATLLVTLGVAQIVKEQERDHAAKWDAWLFSGALGALSWVALIRPSLGDADAGFRSFRIAFATVDVALAALLVLLAIPQSGDKLRRVRVAGMLHLAATTVFAMTGLRGDFSFASPLVITYIGFYVVLIGLGIRGRLHRLAHPEAEPGRPTRALMRSARVAVLSSIPVVSGLAAAIAVAAEPRASALGVAAVAAVLMTLAVVRLRELHTADSKLVDSLRDQCDELRDHNAALAAESERALASLREASDFLADMTERVASPLNRVLEASDELREATASAPRIAPCVDKLVDASDTLLFLVNDLLGIAEASAEPGPVAAVAFSPAELVTQVGESFVDNAARRGVDLVVIGDDAIPESVAAPKAHVETLLRTFVDNAVKFSKPGEVEITMAFIDERPDGVVLRFSVHDNGVGMSREHRQALLSQPRDAEVPTRRYRCKPRGLARVPALVELIGGDWGVESEPGRGSTFWFTAVVQPLAAVNSTYEPSVDALCSESQDVEPPSFEATDDASAATASATPPVDPPAACVAAEDDTAVVAVEPEPEPLPVPEPEPVPVAKPEPEQADAVAPATEDVAPSRPPRSRRVAADTPTESIEAEESETEPRPVKMHGRVLLVEDNPLNRRVTLVTLQQAGFRVEVATNGQEAIDAMTTGAYDAVLMDCEMPVLDGFEATIEIRRMEAGARHTPVIALTVHASHDDQLRAASAGMDDFLAKPFDTRSLLIKLAKWIPQESRTPA